MNGTSNLDNHFLPVLKHCTRYGARSHMAQRVGRVPTRSGGPGLMYTSQALHDDAASFFVFVPTAAACYD